MNDTANVSRGTFHAAPEGARHVQAIYRPRHRDVRVINRAGETLDIPEADVADLVEALATAFAIPAHAHELLRERPANLFNAV